MITFHPQFITDTKGNKTSVVLPMNEFQAILEELEDLEDVREYDLAKKSDTGERITLDDYLKNKSKEKMPDKIYIVVLSTKARKQLDKLNDNIANPILMSLQKLGEEPRPSGCKKLVNREGYRIRIGDYRVLYDIYDSELVYRCYKNRTSQRYL